jgi:peroxiredoxin Q/BCP
MKFVVIGTLGSLSAVVLSFGCTTPPAPAPSNAASPPASIAAPSPSPSASTAAAAQPASAPAPAPSSAPAPSPAAEALIGQPAPDFTAPAQDGKAFHLAAAKGKPVVVYFYPKDETPGCTKEACSFRDAWEALAKTGVVLVGISADASDSHKAFAAHWKLPFALVSDPDGSIGRQYGVPFEGHHKRQTFVIGPDGTVRKVYRTVDVAVHAGQVLEDVRSLGHAS